jgi:hypothetical protein
MRLCEAYAESRMRRFAPCREDVIMEVSAAASSLKTEQLGTVRGAAQLEMLKKSMDAQQQQVAQLIQSVPQPGQPGGVINTFA